MWDLGRDRPALVQPGNRVQFRPVRELVLAAPAPPTAGAAPPADGIVVLSSGLQTTVQDLGRAGHAALGVPGSGALDRGSLRRANRLAGNPADAAALENALGGLALEAVTDQVLAVTGACVPITIDGPAEAQRTIQTDTAFALLAGETLTLGAPTAGVRSYLAFRGGLDVPAVLGSRSTDTLSGIGPQPLVRGTRLGVLAAPPTSVVGAPGIPAAPPAEVTELRFVPGPRSDWFDAETMERFAGTTWTVTPKSNRIGLRLDGEPLERATTGELPSEGTATGSIQLPASGLPVLFLADHPVTGGYPVIGVVLPADLDRAAQLPAGAQIRFVPVPCADPLLPPPAAQPFQTTTRQTRTDR